MMLNTDKQTLDDLTIFENKGKDSVYQLFNQTSTSKGADLLELWFRQPFADETQINDRINVIDFFSKYAIRFPFSGNLFELVEDYLENTDDRVMSSQQGNGLIRWVQDFLGGHDHDYKTLQKGVSSFVEILQVLQSFLKEVEPKASGTKYMEEIANMRLYLQDEEFSVFLKEKNPNRLSYHKVIAFDKKIRFADRHKIRKLMQSMYRLDVYVAVAKAAVIHQFVLPRAIAKERCEIDLDGFYHPLLKDAVPYQLQINPQRNIIFLTGANMAGKSTFMKALGINMYLAHMGFPVAARGMEFSVMDGLYSTINLPDNLSMGYSHFYAEVLRIKKMARELSTGKNLFIIFDELFRGTNVKDAYEATIALTDAFSVKGNCKFVISTHIVEAGEVLMDRRENINFLFLPTIMNGTIPTYTYQLQQGITEDRHGMLIINNEGILELLTKGKTSGQAPLNN